MPLCYSTTYGIFVESAAFMRAFLHIQQQGDLEIRKNALVLALVSDGFPSCSIVVGGGAEGFLFGSGFIFCSARGAWDNPSPGSSLERTEDAPFLPSPINRSPSSLEQTS
jgi:hypothetical protein